MPRELARQPRQYNAIQAIFMFWSPSIWRDVGQRWRGIGFFYLLLLEIVTWGIVLGVAYGPVAHFLNYDAHKLTDQIPTITITKGIVSIDRPEPYFIKSPDTGRPFMCIDTTGEVTTPTETMPVILTRDTLILRSSPTETRILSLKNIQHYQTNGARILSWLQEGKILYWAAGYPILVVACTIMRLILMLLLGAIGLAFAAGTSARVSFAGILRLSILVMTPILLLDTVFMVTPTPPLGMAWVIGAAALELLLLFLAIKANAAPEGAFSTGMQPLDAWVPAAPPGGARPPMPPPPPGPSGGWS